MVGLDSCLIVEITVQAFGGNKLHISFRVSKCHSKNGYTAEKVNMFNAQENYVFYTMKIWEK